MSEPPITWEELETYERFAGDLDGHVRSADPHARVPDSTWRRIDDLRQRLFLAQSTALAPAFAQQLDADLRRHAPDARVLAALRRIVAADRRHAGGGRTLG
jgi:hypothetical protein